MTALWEGDSRSLQCATPDFLWNLVALVHFMRPFLRKGAHAALSGGAWQEIRVRFGRDDKGEGGASNRVWLADDGTADPSGGFGSDLVGEGLTEADAGGKEGALHPRFGNVEQTADHSRSIAFHIAQQEKQALVGRQIAYGCLENRAVNIAVAQPKARGRDRRGFFLVQCKFFAQLVYQGRIDGEPVGPVVLLKDTHKGGGENFFCFQFVGSHVKGEGEDAMAVAFVDVPLLLLAGLLGRLRDHQIRFCSKLAFKVEQSYPDLSDFTGLNEWHRVSVCPSHVRTRREGPEAV
jgi:hypothetical protein